MGAGCSWIGILGAFGGRDWFVMAPSLTILPLGIADTTQSRLLHTRESCAAHGPRRQVKSET
jgi:hypothetical protein